MSRPRHCVLSLKRSIARSSRPCRKRPAGGCWPADRRQGAGRSWCHACAGARAEEKGGPMGAKENVELIEQLQRAAGDLDFDRYGELIAEDATFRVAGVPAALGGVLSGREAVVEQLRQTAGVSRFGV